MKDQDIFKTAELPISEKENMQKKIAELFEKGLDDEDCAGYHGTSLEAVEYLMKNGHLPGAVEAQDKFGYGKGDLFFYPKKSVYADKENPFSEEFESDSEILEYTKGYAEAIARAHYIVVQLGLDLNNQEHQSIGRVLSYGMSDEAEKIIDDLVKDGKKKQEIYDIMNKAMDRKGVVLALDKKIMEDYECQPGHPDDKDLNPNYLRINCPQGLNYKLISGIEPVGQEEWDYFVELQKKIEGN